MDDYRTLIKRAAADERTFLRLTLSGKLRKASAPWVRVVARPVLIKGRRHLQLSHFDATKDVTRNVPIERAAEELDRVLAMSFTRLHVQTTERDLHVKVSRKGDATVTESKPSSPAAEPSLEHDRAKPRPLAASDAFLQAVGITGDSGRVLGGMHGKFAQVSEFLRLLDQSLASAGIESGPLSVVDCGCGSAYLTFAACHYLNDVRGIDSRVVGVDTSAERVAKCLKQRDLLTWTSIDFIRSSIADFAPTEPPHLVLSLHACDTATDAALARGVLWGSRILLAAPCCQHELHKQLRSDAFRAVLRHGVLRERLADVLTDALRAAALRVMGYRADVIEFVSPEATSKNLMIRAERRSAPGDAAAVAEYLALRDAWHVAPAIERLLGERFTALLAPR